MSFAKVYSAFNHLLEQHLISIEADISFGLYAFSIIGLGDKAIGESKDRIGAAIKNSGFKSPKHKNQKVVISLAPADLKKEGPLFDVPMSLAYLLAAKEISFDPRKKIFLGELSLDGTLRKVHGVLPLVHFAEQQGFKEVFVPYENAEEASAIKSITVYGASSLLQIITHLSAENSPGKSGHEKIPAYVSKDVSIVTPPLVDFSTIHGQESAKRGLEIAAAGGHNVLLYGPPGTGKTMLAKAFSGILPELTFKERIEVTSIHSIAGTLREPLLTHPPLRAPHHTSSYTSLVGGGGTLKPGEITLAHKGVLFLDEFPEFDRRVIESLRQPIEERSIHLSRTRGSVKFPAHFILIAAMNPCPCGNFMNNEKICTCSPVAVSNYRQKLSGPIIDRIDIWIEVSKVDHAALLKSTGQYEKSSSVQQRIIAARTVQTSRFSNIKRPISLNGEMSAELLEETAQISETALTVIQAAGHHLKLSARSYLSTIKLARTIADLDKSQNIEDRHIHEALQYRPQFTK